MKETIETIPRIELALIIIGVFVLILGIILGYAMIHEYRIYLDDHYKARYSFRDFISKRLRVYTIVVFSFVRTFAP
mgnify:CR=1 FL=1